MTHCIFIFHALIIGCLTLFCLRLGKEALIAWLTLLAIAMNLFVLKQIRLFGLHVTASDPLAVGYLLGFNLIQEYFGKKYARKAMWITFLMTGSFLILSQFHMLYSPTASDNSHGHYVAILSTFPRLVFASLFTFLCVQLLDLSFFNYLKNKMQGKWLTMRMAFSLSLSQVVDTVLFSTIGLWGLVDSVGNIIIFCLALKLIVVVLSSPFAWISKKIVAYEI